MKKKTLKRKLEPHEKYWETIKPLCRSLMKMIPNGEQFCVNLPEGMIFFQPNFFPSTAYERLLVNMSSKGGGVTKYARSYRKDDPK